MHLYLDLLLRSCFFMFQVRSRIQSTRQRRTTGLERRFLDLLQSTSHGVQFGSKTRQLLWCCDKNKCSSINCAVGVGRFCFCGHDVKIQRGGRIYFTRGVHSLRTVQVWYREHIPCTFISQINKCSKQFTTKTTCYVCTVYLCVQHAQDSKEVSLSTLHLFILKNQLHRQNH